MQRPSVDAAAGGTRIALFENPASGSGDAAAVARTLGDAGAAVESFELDQVEEALATRPARIVVAGGDGSLAPAAATAARAGTPLAIVPTGTANDLARALGLPDSIDDAAKLAAAGTSTRRIDLAWMGERPFLNVASIGLAPAAARRAKGLKRVLGPVSYAVGAVRAAAVAKPVGCLVRCDGAELFAGEAWQATVASSGAFGAGARVEADPADGMLDAVVIAAGPRSALAVRAYGLRSGSLTSQHDVHSARARTVDIELAGLTPFNVDGELVESGSTRFRAEARAVEVVVG
ncbi:MAG TPA: diacylglycerol kinase family protein [Solirubrobacterales bacterium]|nr:diacylglycerol kinase family protein [Solirubrobacterales bacterium]